MNRISGRSGFPQSCADMVRSSVVFTGTALNFCSWARPAIAIGDEERCDECNRRPFGESVHLILPGLAKPSLNLIEESKMAGMRSGLIILTVLLLSGSIAVAQQAGKPCAGDIKTLCAGIQPGEGRIKACIKSHLTDLSPSCQDRVLTVAVTGKVCKADVAKLCAGIEPGTGGIRACIKSHMADVSDPCRDAMSRAAAGRKILGGGDL
jgi:hypothetical protein